MTQEAYLLLPISEEFPRALGTSSRLAVLRRGIGLEQRQERLFDRKIRSVSHRKHVREALDATAFDIDMNESTLVMSASTLPRRSPAASPDHGVVEGSKRKPDSWSDVRARRVIALLGQGTAQRPVSAEIRKRSAGMGISSSTATSVL
ncbi:MAG: hypothetical protein GEV06_28495 [Luteitalea sp.]|nr:hypothetical protein [Luteitalea sp.]